MFLWDRGFGRDSAIKAKSFKDYLAGIPQIPAGLIADDADLPRLSLCDPRPGRVRSCKLLGIQHEELGWNEESGEEFDGRFTLPTVPFWFRHDDGGKNRNYRPDHCRDKAKGDNQVAMAMEGVFAYAHHPNIVVEGEHLLDLPGTVLLGHRAHCACLGVWRGKTGLGLDRNSVFASPSFGTLRVRRK